MLACETPTVHTGLMLRLDHIVLPIWDVEKSIAFYRDLLGLKPKRLLLGSSVQLYALLRHLRLQPLVQRALIPQQYWGELRALRPEA